MPTALTNSLAVTPQSRTPTAESRTRDPSSVVRDSDGDPPGGVPVPVRLARLAALLVERGYGDAARDAALRHAGSWGTVSCCRHVREDDRVDAERTLNCDPRWWSNRWDLIVAADGPGDEF